MTDVPQLYLRRCNGLPINGITITRATVESVIQLLSTSSAKPVGDLDTGLTITIAATRAPGAEPAASRPRVFTFEPLPTGQHRAVGSSK